MSDPATRPEDAVGRLRDLKDGPRRLPEVIALGGAAIPALEALARDPPASIADHRRLAVRALRAIGTRAASQALQRILADSTSRDLGPVERQAEDLVASDAASALGVLGAREEADLLLRTLATRPNAGCAEALGALGDARAVPLLVPCLADATVCASARGALVRFGLAAVPALVGALAPPLPDDGYEGASSVRLRTMAAETLGEIGGPPAAEALSSALRDRQQAVRVAAALALARNGRLGSAAIPVLAEALADERWDVAEEAAGGLSANGEDSALQAVAEVAWASDRRPTRQRAIRVLARWPGLGAARALSGLVDDPDAHLRDSLVEALAGRPEAIARESLEVLARDPEREIRRRAAAALGRGGGGVLGAVRRLLVQRARLTGWRRAPAKARGSP